MVVHRRGELVAPHSVEPAHPLDVGDVQVGTTAPVPTTAERTDTCDEHIATCQADSPQPGIRSSASLDSRPCRKVAAHHAGLGQRQLPTVREDTPYRPVGLIAVAASDGEPDVATAEAAHERLDHSRRIRPHHQRAFHHVRIVAVLVAASHAFG